MHSMCTYTYVIYNNQIFLISYLPIASKTSRVFSEQVLTILKTIIFCFYVLHAVSYILVKFMFTVKTKRVSAHKRERLRSTFYGVGWSAAATEARGE